MILALAACDRAAGPPAVAAIGVTPPAITLLPTQSAILTAEPRDGRGRALPRRAVEWSSSDEAVAAVSPAGTVTAIAPGAATVTASGEGVSASAAVTVRPVPVAAVLVTPAVVVVMVGEGTPLTAAPVDSAGTPLPGRAVTWVSSDPAIATVDSAGRVAGVAPGNAEIAAASEGRSAVARVTVTPVPVAAVTLDRDTATVEVGLTVNLVAAARDAAGSPLADRVITWSTSDTAVATVAPDGLVTAMGPGTVAITAASEGRSTSAAVRVVAALPTAAEDTVFVLTFGDSNTDDGYEGSQSGSRVRSYVSRAPLRLAPSAPHSPLQLAGKIEQRWRTASTRPLVAVNHGIASTTTGGGGHGGTDRATGGSPNARTSVAGVTRFEGEVLAAGQPWSGAEPASTAYPDGAVRRVNARALTPSSFAYVSMGTNDPASGISQAQTVANLAWMIERWVATGQPADQLIITTLAPIRSTPGAVPPLNDEIRALAVRTGVHLVDLAARTSDDNGRSWRGAELHVGDELHYSEAVRDWLAEQVVAHVRAMVAVRP